MVIKPKIKGFICTTSHPKGCEMNVQEQIARTKSHKKINHQGKIKNVLVIGGSTGYGLASRIACTYLLESATLNVCLERPASEGRTASAGWYNTAAFEVSAKKDGFYARTINGDCFSDEVKRKTIDVIKNDLQKIDIVIYSVASVRRTDPQTGETYTSVLKPIGSPVRSKGLNSNNGQLTEVNISPADDDQIASTVKVMGGEDWLAWIRLLEEEKVLSANYITMAYSYIGPEITQAIYRSGTIGKAKEDLEKTAAQISAKSKVRGQALIAVNKALVTQASSAIPILPLYVSSLYHVMKEEGLHEDCIDQMNRLFTNKFDFHSERINPLTDESGMIRLDDWEMGETVQNRVRDIWEKINEDNVLQLVDFYGYQTDFQRLFGFGIDGVDYEQEVNEMVDIPGMIS